MLVVLASLTVRVVLSRLAAIGGVRGAPAGALGRHLAHYLECLGGAFLKAGQVLATRPDLLDGEDRAHLAKLCDRVSTPSPGLCLASLQKGLGPERFARLRDVGEQPIAAGSVACVHRGYRRDTNVEVAIKVLREDAADRFSADLTMIRAAMWVGGRLPWLASVPMREAAQMVVDSVFGNLDLRREAQIHRRMEKVLPTESVSVPGLHADLCTERVLVTDFVSGARRIDDPELPPGSRQSAALTALRALYGMLFRWGLVHCDLHPGNLLVTSEGQLVLIDFGFAAELGPAQRDAFAELFLGMALGEPGRIQQVLIDTARHHPDFLDEPALYRELDRLVGSVSRVSPEKFNVAGFVASLFAIQRRHGIVASPGFTMGIMALVSLEGLLKSFAPQLDFQREAIPYVLG